MQEVRGFDSHRLHTRSPGQTLWGPLPERASVTSGDEQARRRPPALQVGDPGLVIGGRAAALPPSISCWRTQLRTLSLRIPSSSPTSASPPRSAPLPHATHRPSAPLSHEAPADTASLSAPRHPPKSWSLPGTRRGSKAFSGYEVRRRGLIHHSAQHQSHAGGGALSALGGFRLDGKTQRS